MSFEWQFASRVCAWIDFVDFLIWTIIETGIMGYRAITGFKYIFRDLKSSPSPSDTDLESQPEDADGTLSFKVILAIFVVGSLLGILWILAIGLSFRIWIISLLFDATELDVNPESALSNCKSWLGRTIKFQFFGIVNSAFYNLPKGKFAIFKYVLIIRGVMFYIVSRYIAELGLPIWEQFKSLELNLLS